MIANNIATFSSFLKSFKFIEHLLRTSYRLENYFLSSFNEVLILIIVKLISSKTNAIIGLCIRNRIICDCTIH